MEDTMKHN
eukprot:gene17522-23083_t